MGVLSKHGTLTGTAVSTVQLDAASARPIMVMNRAGTADLWVTYGAPMPAVPVASADNTVCVPAGLSRLLDPWSERDGDETVFVKLLGNGNTYSVEAL